MAQITTASKDGLALWAWQEQESRLQEVWRKSGFYNFEWCASGQWIAAWNERNMHVFRGNDGGEEATFNFANCVEKVMTSGDRWLAIKLEGTQDNLQICDMQTKRVVARRTIKDRGIDETDFCFRLNGDTYLLYITPSHQAMIEELAHVADNNVVARLIADRVFSFTVGPPRADPSVCLVALFERDVINKNESSVSLGYVSIDSTDEKQAKVDWAVKSESLGGAVEVELVFNKIGSALLIKESAAVDKSGKSYYGTSKLHVLRTVKNSHLKPIVSQGPVQFYGWSKVDREIFIVGHGANPCQIDLWNASKASPKLDLGKERRNYVAMSNATVCETAGDRPANLVLIGGFGNLPGDVEIWDMDQQKIIGVSKLPWTVDISFSPDNYWLLAATTTPRLRVDNQVRIVKSNGQPVLVQPFDELYRAAWRPDLKVPSRKLSSSELNYKLDGSASNTASSGRSKFGASLSAALLGTAPCQGELRKATIPTATRAHQQQQRQQSARLPSIPGAPGY